MSLIRTSTAIWSGDGMTGKGVLNTQSGVFKSQPYSFKTRFGDESGKAGTNPEELIAAAHAGCFTMALSFMLKGAGFTAEQLTTDASVFMGLVDGHFEMEKIKLSLKARVPGISADAFRELTESAKVNCPISKALASVKVELDAVLLD